METQTNLTTNVDTTHTIDLSDNLYKVMLGVLAIGTIFLLGHLFIQFRNLPQNNPHDITVSGEGRAYAKPDIATISFGAHTEAPKSQDAVNQNNAIMNKVIEEIKKLGVEDKDIQTTSYNLQPVYDYGVRTMPAVQGSAGVAISYPYPGAGTQVLRGYALDQQIQVKIRNFDNINAVLDVAGKNGANTIGSLMFTVDDMEKIKAEAREKAIKQAKEKASSMFKEAGLRGATLVNISEGYGYYPMYGVGGALEKASDATPAPVPNVQPGQMEIPITITLTYRVR
jgi:uncharacterized protein YggE